MASQNINVIRKVPVAPGRSESTLLGLVLLFCGLAAALLPRAEEIASLQVTSSVFGIFIGGLLVFSGMRAKVLQNGN